MSAVAAITLNREFEVDAPNKVWVTEFTYIRTHKGWLYLAEELDQFSPAVVVYWLSSGGYSNASGVDWLT